MGLFRSAGLSDHIVQMNLEGAIAEMFALSQFAGNGRIAARGDLVIVASER
jgi:hypothetical protein